MKSFIWSKLPVKVCSLMERMQLRVSVCVHFHRFVLFSSSVNLTNCWIEEKVKIIDIGQVCPLPVCLCILQVQPVKLKTRKLCVLDIFQCNFACRSVDRFIVRQQVPITIEYNRSYVYLIVFSTKNVIFSFLDQKNIS